MADWRLQCDGKNLWTFQGGTIVTAVTQTEGNDREEKNRNDLSLFTQDGA